MVKYIFIYSKKELYNVVTAALWSADICRVVKQYSTVQRFAVKNSLMTKVILLEEDKQFLSHHLTAWKVVKSVVVATS